MSGDLAGRVVGRIFSGPVSDRFWRKYSHPFRHANRGPVLHRLQTTVTLTLTGTVGVDTPPSGFPRITRERIGQSSRNLAFLSFEQFYAFPENLKSVLTMTFDLWPDFQGHVKRNLRSVPFQCLKLANFGIYAGDMDMGQVLGGDIHGFTLTS